MPEPQSYKWQPNDRQPVAVILGRTLSFKVGKKKREFKDITFRQQIELYRLSKKYPKLLLYANRLKKKKFKLTRFIKDFIKFRIIMNNIRKQLKDIVGFKPKPNEISKLFRTLLLANKNPFLEPPQKNPGLWDRYFEHWAFVMIDKVAHAYGWSFDEIMDTPYPVILEMIPTINNREIRDKMDDIGTSVAAHVGSKEIVDDLRRRMQRRDVKIPKEIMRKENDKELLKLMPGGKKNG